DDRLADDAISRIVSEFPNPTNNNVVAYRGRYRWERDFEPVKLPKAERGRLRPGGVYVITGGTGGIGLSISKYLAQACQPRIVLTKKTPFPEKSRWREILTAGNAPEPVLRTIKALVEIEQMGAEVEVLVAESSDR